MHDAQIIGLFRWVSLAGLMMMLVLAAASCAESKPKSVVLPGSVAAAPAAATSRKQGRLVALVIGNDAYLTAPLPASVNDAQVMEEALEALGFEVLTQTDVTRKAFRELIRDFGNLLQVPGTAGLFYYSGHGMQVNGRNYMIPIDADIQSEADVEDDGIPVEGLLGRMDVAKSSPNIVVLDACRNNPYEKRFKGFQKGLAPIGAPAGTLIAYATAPGKVAQSGPRGSNSPFTAVLAQEMLVPAPDVLTVFRTTAKKVIELTRGEQTPYLEMPAYFPDFSFTRGPSPLVDLPQPTEPGATSLPRRDYPPPTKFNILIAPSPF